jgi:hypothetical protein
MAKAKFKSSIRAPRPEIVDAAPCQPDNIARIDRA